MAIAVQYQPLAVSSFLCDSHRRYFCVYVHVCALLCVPGMREQNVRAQAHKTIEKGGGLFFSKAALVAETPQPRSH